MIKKSLWGFLNKKFTAMLISICIPTYNRPEHLKNCLNSLAKQTYKNFEVCVSDNHSNSNIRKIVKSFKKKLKVIMGYLPDSRFWKII